MSDTKTTGAAQPDLSQSWIVELRNRLISPPPSRLPAKDGARPAAVLVPLYVEAGELWTMLTVRSAELPTHKSQIAFPGGGRETGESPWDAALRESEEEIGLDRSRVLQLGQLDEAQTPSGFRIVPCVGAIPAGIETAANDDEIAEVFTVPLSAFVDVRVVEDRRVKIEGVERNLRIYHVGRRQIWGLTARIIQSLMVRLGVETSFGRDSDD